MIQRIQSLLLLVATICFVATCFMPVAFITTHEAYYVLTSWSVQENIPDGAIIHPTYFIGLLQVLLAVLSFVTIFFYRKRPLQSKMCLVAMLANFVLLLLMLWVYPDKTVPQIPQLDGGELQYSLWTLLSIVPLACYYFANKFIIKDEKMIRAADRLR